MLDRRKPEFKQNQIIVRDRSLTKSEVKDILRVSFETVNRLLREGKLKIFNDPYSTRERVSKDSLNQLLIGWNRSNEVI